MQTNKNKTKKYQPALFLVMIIFCCLFLFNPAEAADPTSGIYTSSIYNTTHNTTELSNFGTITWTNSGSGGTISVKVRTGNNSVIDATWIGWVSATNNSDLSAALDGKQYVQYEATLSTPNSDVVPILNSINIDYFSASIPLTGSLVSSKYDTTSYDNRIGTPSGVSWKYVTGLPSGGSVKMYLQTSDTAAGLDTAIGSAAWQEITSCTGGTTAGSMITCTGIPANLNSCNTPNPANCNDKWFIYKVELNLGGGVSPVVDDITVYYKANLATPTLDKITATTLSSYASLGTFTSGVYNTIANTGFGNITFDHLDNTGSLTIRAKSCAQPNCSDKPAWNCEFSSNTDLTGACVTDGEQYVQYQAELTRGTDATQTPSLDKITIGFEQFPIFLPVGGINVPIRAHIIDKDNLSDVLEPSLKAYIHYPNGTTVDTINLTDAGHANPVAGDNVYGNTLWSALGKPEGTYTIDIEACDKKGNCTDTTHHNIGSFVVAKKQDGEACTVDAECSSGNCCDFVCTSVTLLTFNNSIHSECECIALGGTVESVPGGTICKITGTGTHLSVPSGWTQADSWQKYSSSPFYGDWCGNHTSTGPTVWSNEASVCKIPGGCIGGTTSCGNHLPSRWHCSNGQSAGVGTESNCSIYRAELGIY